MKLLPRRFDSFVELSHESKMSDMKFLFFFYTLSPHLHFVFVGEDFFYQWDLYQREIDGPLRGRYLNREHLHVLVKRHSHPAIKFKRKNHTINVFY